MAGLASVLMLLVQLTYDALPGAPPARDIPISASKPAARVVAISEYIATVNGNIKLTPFVPNSAR